MNTKRGEGRWQDGRRGGKKGGRKGGKEGKKEGRKNLCRAGSKRTWLQRSGALKNASANSEFVLSVTPLPQAYEKVLQSFNQWPCRLKIPRYWSVHFKKYTGFVLIEFPSFFPQLIFHHSSISLYLSPTSFPLSQRKKQNFSFPKSWPHPSHLFSWSKYKQA